LTIDTAAHAVSLAGKHLELRRHEYELLLFLASDPRRVFHRRATNRRVGIPLDRRYTDG